MLMAGRPLDRGSTAERGQFRLRRLERRPWGEQPENRDGRAGPRRRRHPVGPQGHPQLVRDREGETLPHHADHRHVLVSELYGPAEHVRVAAKAHPPQVVTEHGDSRGAGLLVGWGKDTPQERRCSCHPKARGGDLGGLDGTRDAICGDQVAGDVAPCAELGDRAQRAAPDDKIVQDARLESVGRDVPVLDLDDALAGRQRQRRMHEQRCHLEDDRPYADRKRHRQPADDGQARILHQHPAPELQVEPEAVQPPEVRPPFRSPARVGGAAADAQFL
jgi:hypothetical protein